MKCDAVELKIALYASGDLDPGDAAVIDSHISRCAACGIRLEQFREDLRALHSLREEPVDQPDRDAVRRSVMAQIGLRQGRTTRLHSLYWPAAVAAAAAASIALLAWWVIYLKTARSPSEPAPAAAIATKPAGPVATASVHEPIPAPTQGKNPNRVARTGSRTTPVRGRAGIPGLSAFSKPDLFMPAQLPPDDIAIKLETDDPNVVIIWLASSKRGELR